MSKSSLQVGGQARADGTFESFSQVLEGRLQRFYLERYGLNLSSSQAQEYLHSLADLFLLLANLTEEELPDGCAGLPQQPTGAGQDGRGRWPP